MTKPKGPTPQEAQRRYTELRHRRDVLLELVHETQTELDRLKHHLPEFTDA